MRWLTLGMLIFCISCANEEVPDNVLAQEEMTLLLKDLYIMDGVIQESRGANMKQRHLVRDQLHEGLLQRYGLNRDEFMKSYNYYLNQPGKMDSMHTDIISLLDEQLSDEREKRYHID